MRWTEDGGEWLDEEVDASDVMDRKHFLEPVLSRASVVSISKRPDIREGEHISGNMPAWEKGDFGRPIPVIARLLHGEENQQAGAKEDKEKKQERR